ncbi:hypothetical protein CYMTET_47747 [Cymbomonas tetramitiformis]|uniref:Uncharacterized protein n=1 Tax=Cymbomonas tetramitiformis TaxID=36881 RepID=A0AAE0EVP0_9CHLO|nr:hypothetical protein CYMTET_47747 [Cymbomonas tetramitiformis]|eukprot:gene377-708_t
MTDESSTLEYDRLIREQPNAPSADIFNVKLEHRLVHQQWTETRRAASEAEVLEPVRQEFDAILMHNLVVDGRLTEDSVTCTHARVFIAFFHFMIMDTTSRVSNASSPRDRPCQLSIVWNSIKEYEAK